MRRVSMFLILLLLVLSCPCSITNVCFAWDKAEREIMGLIQAHEKSRMMIGGARFSTRDNMIKSLYLAKEGNIQTAVKIIREIAKVQNTDRRSRHYGNFPTLAGDKQLDYNWSAFIGSYLAYFYLEYGKQLNEEQRLLCKEIISRAAIHRKSQMWNRPDTTNINVLTAYFLLSAGKILQDGSLRKEGEAFWEHFYKQSSSEGIREFNGLNYISVHLYGLGFIAQHEQYTHIGEEAKLLRNLILWNIVSRYHSDLRQLAGPYKRTPEDSRMGDRFEPIQEYLFEGSYGKFPRAKLREESTPLQLLLLTMTAPPFPDKWVSAVLKGDNLNKHYRERVRGNNRQFEQTTTYMNKSIALGSVNHAKVSYYPRQQSRPIIAHIASKSTGVVIGEFRVLVRSRAGNNTDIYLNSVQHRTSVLTEMFTGLQQSPMEIVFEWQGGKLQLDSCKGDRISGLWEGLPFTIMLAPGAAITQPCIRQGDIVQTVISTLSEKDNNFRFSMGFSFGESLQSANKLSAPEVAVKDRKYLLGWRSPDGLLQMTRNSNDMQSLSYKINGREIPAYPIGYRIGEFIDHD